MQPYPSRRNPAPAGTRAWRPARLAGAALALLAPGLAAAAQWDYVPTIMTGLAYETNPRYVSQDELEDDAGSLFVDGSLDIINETQRRTLGARPRVRISRYQGTEDDSSLDTDDWYLPVNATWRDVRTQYALRAQYSDVSTRDSETFVTDPNDPGQPGSSGRLVPIEESQQRWFVSPSASYQLSARDVLSATLSYDDVSYDKAELTNRSDYEYGYADTTWTRSLGLKDRVSGTLNVSGFRAQQPGNTVENETFTYGFNVGYQHAYSDLTTFGVTAGYSRSDVSLSGLPAVNGLPCFDPGQQQFVLCELESSEDNFVGEAFVRQATADTITTELRVSRSIRPNSDGAQTTADSLSLYVTKEFGPLLEGSIGATYVAQEAVGADVAGALAQRFDRDYMRFDVTVERRLSRTWWLNGRYSYSSDEQSSGFSAETENHVVSVFVRYGALGRY
jgi:hypothetical protein